MNAPVLCSWLAVVALLLNGAVACGGVASADDAERESGTSPTNEPSGQGEREDADPYPFTVVSSEATAFRYACPDEGTNDRVILRAFEAPGPERRGRFVQLQVRRDATASAPIALQPDGPRGVEGCLFDARGREGGGNSVCLLKHPRSEALWPAVASATLWPEATPSVDGAAAVARARVRFTDGRVLDLTVEAPLATTDDPCGD